LTCIAAGLDDRLKVAVPVYGCGFIHENSAWIPIFDRMSEEQRNAWVENFEPSRYLGHSKMPTLFVNGTNDQAYPLDSYQKSYRLVRRRMLCVTVEMPHGHQPGWSPVEIGLFVDQHLRDGTPLTQINSARREDNHLEVEFTAALPIQKAALHFTTDTNDWNHRKWHTRESRLDASTVNAELPEERPIVYFLTLTDSRNATVSSEHEIVAT